MGENTLPGGSDTIIEVTEFYWRNLHGLMGEGNTV